MTLRAARAARRHVPDRPDMERPLLRLERRLRRALKFIHHHRKEAS